MTSQDTMLLSTVVNDLGVNEAGLTWGEKLVGWYFSGYEPAPHCQERAPRQPGHLPCLNNDTILLLYYFLFTRMKVHLSEMGVIGKIGKSSNKEGTLVHGVLL